MDVVSRSERIGDGGEAVRQPSPCRETGAGMDAHYRSPIRQRTLKRIMTLDRGVVFGQNGQFDGVARIRSAERTRQRKQSVYLTSRLRIVNNVNSG
jgi:hypothetical protein